MRKYSPVIALVAIVAAMMILQVGTKEVGASSATISSQSGQIQTFPMDRHLAKGDDTDTGDNKKVAAVDEKSNTPDLRTVDWSETPSVKDSDDHAGSPATVQDEDEGGDGGDKEGGDEEGHGNEAGGKEDEASGFDRLWDVATNG